MKAYIILLILLFFIFSNCMINHQIHLRAGKVENSYMKMEHSFFWGKLIQLDHSFESEKICKDNETILSVTSYLDVFSAVIFTYSLGIYTFLFFKIDCGYEI